MKRTIMALALVLMVAQIAHASTPPPYAVHLPLITAPVNLAAEMGAIVRYLVHVYEDGDTANDWLTHVHPEVASALEALGQAIVGRDRFVFTITFEGELHDQAEFLRGYQWARREGLSPYQSMWIGMGEVLDDYLQQDVMDDVWLVIEEQCVN